MKNIIFIFSLPRSGSTLLQRMLMAHYKIISTNEPWFLLPLFYPILNEQNAYTEYGYEVSANGVKNLINQLPKGKKDYYQEVNNFTKNIYNKIGNEKAIYFIDKTPRYYLIIPEIAKAFPEAKFIFLFRNPLSIYASICNTWRYKTCYLNNYDKMDLTKGLYNLIKGYELLKNKSIKINYEDLTTNPKKGIKKICEYLNIEFDEKMIKNFFNEKLQGKNLGDPNINKYHYVQTKSLNKWKNFFNTGWRKRKAKKYLKRLSEETLTIAGYNKQKLINDIKKNKTKPLKNITNALNLLKEVSKKIIRKIWKKKNR